MLVDTRSPSRIISVSCGQPESDFAPQKLGADTRAVQDQVFLDTRDRGVIPPARNSDSRGLIPESVKVRFCGCRLGWKRDRHHGQADRDHSFGLSAAELREQAAKTHDGAVVRRLLGIALVLEGHSREAAATAVGMDRQTLCDWIHRYNEGGVAGLSSHTRPGRPPALTEAQMQELKALVLAGPDPERHEVIRWRCADLRDEFVARWSVELHERTISKLLHRLGLTRLQPRPSHPQKDAAAQEAFKKTSLIW